MENAPKYKAFQKQVEQTVSNLSLVTLFEKDNMVTNRIPEYVDKKLSKVILKDSLRPWCDLYVRTGYGMYYKNGSWSNDEKDFEQACQEAGYNAKEVLEKVKNSLEQNEWNPNNDHEISLEYVDPIEKFKWQRLLEKGKLSIQFGQGYDLLNSISSYEEVDDESPLCNWYWNYVCTAIKERYKSEEIVSSFLENREGMDMQSIEMLDFLNMYDRNSIDEIPKGRDPIEYFLNESHQGYCVHFASAAALMLQRLGIPARYCTGYIVKRSAFQHVSRGVYEAEVLDRNAHAWVEIYMPGYGWIPYEMTPGLEETALPKVCAFY